MRVLKFIAAVALICCLAWLMIRNIEQVNDTPIYDTGVSYGEAVIV